MRSDVQWTTFAYGRGHGCHRRYWTVAVVTFQVGAFAFEVWIRNDPDCPSAVEVGRHYTEGNPLSLSLSLTGRHSGLTCFRSYAACCLLATSCSPFPRGQSTSSCSSARTRSQTCPLRTAGSCLQSTSAFRPVLPSQQVKVCRVCVCVYEVSQLSVESTLECTRTLTPPPPPSGGSRALEWQLPSTLLLTH